MVEDFKPRYDYNKQSRNEDKELIKKLDPEKIDEFKAFLTELDVKIKIQFGPPGGTERIRFDKINNFVDNMSECKALAILTYYDNSTKDLINYRKISSNFYNGEDALDLLKVEFGDKLKLPWMRRMNLFDYPFETEYKETKDSKYVSLTMEFRKANIVAKYRLLIRGIKIARTDQPAPTPEL